MGFISMWAQGVIVSVIIATIIEMILPNGSSSKYIKMVIGVFVLFTIVSPIINKFSDNSEINFDSYIETSTDDTIATSVNLNNEDAIKSMYEQNLKIDIKTKVSQRGYTVGDINLDILDNDEYTLNKIDIHIISKNDVCNQDGNSNVTTIVENVENIKIDIGGGKSDEEEKSVISESEKKKLKEYLSGVYEVMENNISVS